MLIYNYKTKKKEKEVDKTRKIIEDLGQKYPNAKYIQVDALGNVTMEDSTANETDFVNDVEAAL